MNIIFFGSDDFALAHLEAILSSEHKVAAIVTQPDKPRDRGMKVHMSPLKEKALEQNLKIFQPQDFKEENFIAELDDIKADIFVVVAYGRFLPPALLNIPPKGAINVHASLLPKYRGAAPINWAIINGDAETGLTIFNLNPQMDAGDILSQIKMPILPGDTAVTLRAKMKQCGAEFLLDTLRSIEANKVNPMSQDKSLVSLAPKITREMGKIDWHKSAVEIERMVRGLLPDPCAYTFYKGEMLKILSAEVIDHDEHAIPGEPVRITKDSFSIQTGKGCIKVKQLKLSSGKQMDAGSFLRGHKL